MRRMLHGFWMFCAVFLLSALTASAQVDRATLSGVVKDTNGGVLPGATVAVTNLGTNQVARQQTTEAGGPGTDRLSAEKTPQVLRQFACAGVALPRLLLLPHRLRKGASGRLPGFESCSCRCSRGR